MVFPLFPPKVYGDKGAKNSDNVVNVVFSVTIMQFSAEFFLSLSSEQCSRDPFRKTLRNKHQSKASKMKISI